MFFLHYAFSNYNSEGVSKSFILPSFRLSAHLALILLYAMQTDPNWSNFLYDEAKKTINLIDFGAARDYPKSFVDDYLRMVKSPFFLFN